MAAWLAWVNGGHPETLEERKYYHGRPGSALTVRPVVDAETVALWWRKYRAQIAWAQPRQTYNAFLAECAKALGFKGKSFAERIAAARSALSQNERNSTDA
jgi:hypothetical protein